MCIFAGATRLDELPVCGHPAQLGHQGDCTTYCVAVVCLTVGGAQPAGLRKQAVNKDNSNAGRNKRDGRTAQGLTNDLMTP